MLKKGMITKALSKIKRKELVIALVVGAMMLLCFGALGVAEIKGKVPDYATHMGYDGEEQVIYYLTDGDAIKQEFTSPKDFDAASLHFSDHEQVISGKTLISVTEKETGEQVCYLEKNNSEIHYGQLLMLDFATEGKAGITYVISVNFEGMGDKGLGIFGIPAIEGKEPAQINGLQKEYCVAVGTHTYTDCFIKIVIVTILMAALMVMISIVLVTQTQMKEEGLFLGIAIPMGIAFLLFVSANIVHDGPTHLAKVYHYSNVLLGKGEMDKRGSVYLRMDEAEAFEEWYNESRRSIMAREIYWSALEDFTQKAESEEWVYSHMYRENNASSFLEYFPAIIGMTLGRVFGGSAYFNIFLAKLFSFIFYLIFVYWSIKISPHLKSVIAFAALLPMSMYQATGITYDSVIIAVGMMTFALFLKAREEMLKRSEIVVLFLSALILGCCKGGFYLLLLLLFLVIPRRTYGSFSKKCFICLGAIGTGGIGLICTYLNTYLPEIKRLFESMTVVEAEQAGEIVENGGQRVLDMVPETSTAACGVGFVLEAPLDFAKMLVTTVAQKLDFYFGTLIGYRMAWSDMLVPWVLIFAFAALILLAGSDREQKPMLVTNRERLVAGCLFGLEMLGFHILMLVETPIGSSIINGVQGRYFIAWIPVIAFVLYNKCQKNDEKGIRRLFVCYSVAEAAFLYVFVKIFLGIAV